ncbi:sulfotransferase family 2 domain-containing protein [Winogradskyella ursingii]|uniref:sulfotransferase family 2 domain-containing protein n=1 Tax=Winogradskyella ursingii TaxID=2686079 RepID=UPI0015CD562B|nr:sulfotransferase family 2 domain-containing protein [Winogradskyella ursingii]
MVFHKQKCIFIHIPKCAGSSILKFFEPETKFYNDQPDYNILYGWCPDRKIHLQHATSKELLETNLIDQQTWDNYYKFTFVRNPWDRAYSDYLWMKKELKTEGPFKDFLLQRGNFKKRLTKKNIDFRGDHLYPQTDFFDINGKYEMDFVGRFEFFNQDISFIISQLNLNRKFDVHVNKSKSRFNHYSKFYNKKKKNMVAQLYAKDIEKLNYSFEERKNFQDKIRVFLSS